MSWRCNAIVAVATTTLDPLAMACAAAGTR
jgi:hypothetical protein